MATNALQVATINSVGDFILFLGKVMVAALSGLIGIFVLKDKPGLNFYMAPVILIIIFSFFMAHIVLSLFEVTTFDNKTVNIFNHAFSTKDGRGHIVFMCLRRQNY